MSQYLRNFLRLRQEYERLYRIKYIHQELHQQKQKKSEWVRGDDDTSPLRNFMGHSTPNNTFVI